MDEKRKEFAQRVIAGFEKSIKEDEERIVGRMSDIIKIHERGSSMVLDAGILQNQFNDLEKRKAELAGMQKIFCLFVDK